MLTDRDRFTINPPPQFWGAEADGSSIWGRPNHSLCRNTELFSLSLMTATESLAGRWYHAIV